MYGGLGRAQKDGYSYTTRHCHGNPPSLARGQVFFQVRGCRGNRHKPVSALEEEMRWMTTEPRTRARGDERKPHPAACAFRGESESGSVSHPDMRGGKSGATDSDSLCASARTCACKCGSVHDFMSPCLCRQKAFFLGSIGGL